MKRNLISLLGLLILGVVIACPFIVQAAESASKAKLKLFDGKAKLLLVNGYSTSFHWPKVLQAKLDKHFDGKRMIEVRSAVKGGTPISKWIDLKTGKGLAPWQSIVKPALAGGKKRPVIVLGQQSLQWVWEGRSAGIRNQKDKVRIKQGADAIEKYVRLLKKDGAVAVFVAMHIYKKPMEPQIGFERLALKELLSRGIEAVYGGPDVWTPTKQHYPAAFAGDKMHPNDMGAQIMAQKWFETLLKHDGIKIPAWSIKQMSDAIAKGAGASSVTSGRGAQAGPGNTARASGGRAPLSKRVLDRYDKDKDGKLSDTERAAFDKARAARRRNKR